MRGNFGTFATHIAVRGLISSSLSARYKLRVLRGQQVLLQKQPYTSSTCIPSSVKRTMARADVDASLPALQHEQCSGEEQPQQSQGSAKPKQSSKSKQKQGRLLLQTPKGTTDFGPADMALRDQIFGTLVRVFREHGGVAIDTPVFELREILMNKYGEDDKLIYEMAEQGGQACALRYDLTVPFARYVAMNKVAAIRRYHIGKVYRRDQPVMSKGRRREFVQCDFDIAGGTADPMLPDAEVIAVLVRALRALFKEDVFCVRINHRGLLDAIMTAAGATKELFKPLTAALDKLDKVSWAEVRAEMLVKGASEETADFIGQFAQIRGPCNAGTLKLVRDAFEKASATNSTGVSPACDKVFSEIELLFEYTEALGVRDVCQLDMSLARGLDYYTGIIFEAVLTDEPTTAELRQKSEESKKQKADRACDKPKRSEKKSQDDRADAENECDESAVGVGSIAAGGRYDELVGMFMAAEAVGGSGKAASRNAQVPCVGMSVGVERIFAVLKQRLAAKGNSPRASPTQVYVMAAGGGVLRERLQACRELWEAGVRAEYSARAKPRLQAQFNACERDAIPLAVILGPDEVEAGVVRIKDMRAKDESVGAGVTIQRADMISEVMRRLAEIELGEK